MARDRGELGVTGSGRGARLDHLQFQYSQLVFRNRPSLTTVVEQVQASAISLARELTYREARRKKQSGELTVVHQLFDEDIQIFGGVRVIT